MDELFRYQQIRQSQRLSGEEKRSLGLSLYPDAGLSALAKDLIDINTGASVDSTTDRRIAEHLHSTKLIEDLSDLPPAIRAIYDWLEFKSRPIKLTDLSAVVGSLPGLDGLELAEAWSEYADNLLVAVYGQGEHQRLRRLPAPDPDLPPLPSRHRVREREGCRQKGDDPGAPRRNPREPGSAAGADCPVALFRQLPRKACRRDPPGADLRRASRPVLLVYVR